MSEPPLPPIRASQFGLDEYLLSNSEPYLFSHPLLKALEFSRAPKAFDFLPGAKIHRTIQLGFIVPGIK